MTSPRDTNHNASNPETIELPPDLAALVTNLDALAAAEASFAPARLEDSIFATSCASLTRAHADIAPVADALDALAHREQQVASTNLESRAFELSREAITSGRAAMGPATLRLVGSAPADHASPIIVARPWRSSHRFMALAAALAAAGLGISIYTTMRSTITITLVENTPNLSENLDTELNTLFEVMETSYSEASSPSRAVEPTLDANWLEEVYGQESL